MEYSLAQLELTKHHRNKIIDMLKHNRPEIKITTRLNPESTMMLPIYSHDADKLEAHPGSYKQITLTPHHIMSAEELIHKHVPEEHRGGFLPFLAGLLPAIGSALPAILGGLGGLGSLAGGIATAVNQGKQAAQVGSGVEQDEVKIKLPRKSRKMYAGHLRQNVNRMMKSDDSVRPSTTIAQMQTPLPKGSGVKKGSGVW